MGSELEDRIRKSERLNLEVEIANKEKTVAEAKRIEKEAKKDEGKGWKKALGVTGKLVGSLRVNEETLQTLHGLGYGHLKDYNDPSKIRRRR